jgi:checkpoint serine/threonine-protein kinase
MVNLEALYPSPDIVGSELSLEELRAARRGWLTQVWVSQKQSNPVANEPVLLDEQFDVVEPITQKVEKLVIARDPVTVPLDENGAMKETNREGRGRKMKIKEVNETQISQSNASGVYPYG